MDVLQCSPRPVMNMADEDRQCRPVVGREDRGRVTHSKDCRFTLARVMCRARPAYALLQRSDFRILDGSRNHPA